MIPKIIHYCWVGPGKYPKLIRKCLATWKKQLPDYEFILWNKENSPFDVQYVQDAYAAKKYAYCADYIRYWALYNYGGIYLDMDVYLTGNFDKFLDCHSFWASEHSYNMAIGTEVIGAEKHDPFIKAVLDKYDTLTFDATKLEELKCPRIFALVYAVYPHPEQLTMLPYDTFYPFPYAERQNAANFLSYATENTVAIHMWNMGWVSDWVKFKREIKRRYRTLRERIIGLMAKG